MNNNLYDISKLDHVKWVIETKNPVNFVSGNKSYFVLDYDSDYLYIKPLEDTDTFSVVTTLVSNGFTQVIAYDGVATVILDIVIRAKN